MESTEPPSDVCPPPIGNEQPENITKLKTLIKEDFNHFFIIFLLIFLVYCFKESTDTIRLVFLDCSAAKMHRCPLIESSSLVIETELVSPFR